MLSTRICIVSTDVGLEHRKGAISTARNKVMEDLAQFLTLHPQSNCISMSSNGGAAHNEG